MKTYRTEKADFTGKYN